MLELNKTMDNEMLKMVCGGDYGDEDKDNNPNQSWYQVGEHKEIYNTIFHKTTTRYTIEDKKFEDGHWKYKFTIDVTDCDSDDGSCTVEKAERWFSATEIER